MAGVKTHKVAQADGNPLCLCRDSRAGGRVAMVEDVVRRVAVVTRAVEVAKDEGATHEAAGARGTMTVA